MSGTLHKRQQLLRWDAGVIDNISPALHTHAHLYSWLEKGPLVSADIYSAHHRLTENMTSATEAQQLAPIHEFMIQEWAAFHS